MDLLLINIIIHLGDVDSAEVLKPLGSLGLSMHPVGLSPDSALVPNLGPQLPVSCCEVYNSPCAYGPNPYSDLNDFFLSTDLGLDFSHFQGTKFYH